MDNCSSYVCVWADDILIVHGGIQNVHNFERLL
jgi:hypothetical protein